MTSGSLLLLMLVVGRVQADQQTSPVDPINAIVRAGDFSGSTAVKQDCDCALQEKGISPGGRSAAVLPGSGGARGRGGPVKEADGRLLIG